MARYVAKNIVAAGLARKCEVQLAYAIGVAQPLSVLIDTFDTGEVSDELIGKLVREHFELTPRGIIETLDLKRPIYERTAAYGHFGRTAGGRSSSAGSAPTRPRMLRRAAGGETSVRAAKSA